MDAVEFLKAAERRANSNPEWLGSSIPLYATNYNALVAQVEQWSKEHPVKTRQSEFLKMFPNALITDEDALGIYPCKIDKTIKLVACSGDCTRCRRDYWLQEVE